MLKLVIFIILLEIHLTFSWYLSVLFTVVLLPVRLVRLLLRYFRSISPYSVSPVLFPVSLQPNRGICLLQDLAQCLLSIRHSVHLVQSCLLTYTPFTFANIRRIYCVARQKSVLDVYPIRLRYFFSYLLVSTPSICKRLFSTAMDGGGFKQQPVLFDKTGHQRQYKEVLPLMRPLLSVAPAFGWIRRHWLSRSYTLKILSAFHSSLAPPLYYW